MLLGLLFLCQLNTFLFIVAVVPVLIFDRKVVCPEMTVTGTSALGCEFKLDQKPTRTPLADLPPNLEAREKGLEERFDIR